MIASLGGWLLARTVAQPGLVAGALVAAGAVVLTVIVGLGVALAAAKWDAARLDRQLTAAQETIGEQRAAVAQLEAAEQRLAEALRNCSEATQRLAVEAERRMAEAQQALAQANARLAGEIAKTRALEAAAARPPAPDDPCPAGSALADVRAVWTGRAP